MKTKEFKNSTDLEFTNIESEIYRIYHWVDFELRIDFPSKINVSKSGGHRVWNSKGKSFYIEPGWRYIEWEVSDGSPNFVK